MQFPENILNFPVYKYEYGFIVVLLPNFMSRIFSHLENNSHFVFIECAFTIMEMIYT